MGDFTAAHSPPPMHVKFNHPVLLSSLAHFTHGETEARRGPGRSQDPPREQLSQHWATLPFVAVEMLLRLFEFPFAKRQVVLCAEIVIQKLQTPVVSMETFFTLCK